jgi:hypothetical protein
VEEDEPAGTVTSVLARGESARVGDRLPGDPQCGDEADPVRVVPGVGGRLGHQGADRVVAAQVAPDFLEDQVGGPRSQHGTGVVIKRKMPKWHVKRGHHAAWPQPQHPPDYLIRH